jgi:purine-cytosine permease-like protein
MSRWNPATWFSGFKLSYLNPLTWWTKACNFLKQTFMSQFDNAIQWFFSQFLHIILNIFNPLFAVVTNTFVGLVDGIINLSLDLGVWGIPIMVLLLLALSMAGYLAINLIRDMLPERHLRIASRKYILKNVW